MTKKEICLALAGILACSVLAYGIVAVGFPDGGHSRKPVPPGSTSVQARQLRHDDGEASAVQVARAEPDPVAVPVVNPAPGDTAMVSDQALLRLSGMVNLANAMNEPPNEAEWQQALPIAEKLLVSPCDCAQRNWLNHFVAMGNHALHGSEDEYKKSAQLIVTLGRNNDQAVAISKGLY